MIELIMPLVFILFLIIIMGFIYYKIQQSDNTFNYIPKGFIQWLDSQPNKDEILKNIYKNEGKKLHH